MAITLTGGMLFTGGINILNESVPLSGIYFDPSKKASAITLSNSNYTMNFDSVALNSVALGFTNGQPVAESASPPIYIVEFQVDSVGPIDDGYVKFGAGVISGTGAPSNYTDSTWYNSSSSVLAATVGRISGGSGYSFSSGAFSDPSNFSLSSKIGLGFKYDSNTGLVMYVFVAGDYKGTTGTFSISGNITPYASYRNLSSSNASQGQITIYSDLNTMTYKTQYLAQLPTAQSWPAAV